MAGQKVAQGSEGTKWKLNYLAARASKHQMSNHMWVCGGRKVFFWHTWHREVQWKYLDETNPNKRSGIRNTCVHGNKKRGLGMCWSVFIFHFQFIDSITLLAYRMRDPRISQQCCPPRDYTTHIRDKKESHLLVLLNPIPPGPPELWKHPGMCLVAQLFVG